MASELKAPVEASIDDIITDGNVRFAAVPDPALVRSISAQGIIQPLVVKPVEGGWELIAGHRRLAAAREAGLSRVPIAVRYGPLDEGHRTAMQLAENIHREDLSAWEQAQATWDMKVEGGLNQDEISTLTGIPKGEISQLQKVAKSILADDAVEVGELVPFSLEGLEDLATAKARPSDVLRTIRDDENGGPHALHYAITTAEKEQEIADFLDELSPQLRRWSEQGIEVTYEDPGHTLSKDGRNLAKPNVQRIGDTWSALKVPLAEHMDLECHIVYVKIPKQRYGGSPQVLHYCTQVKTHYGKDVALPAEDAKEKLAAEKRSTKQREQDRERKAQRKTLVAKWLTEPTPVKVVRELALARFVDGLYFQSWKDIASVLGLGSKAGEQEVREWAATQKDPNAALLKAAIASEYVGGTLRRSTGALFDELVLPGFEKEETDGTT